MSDSSYTQRAVYVALLNAFETFGLSVILYHGFVVYQFARLWWNWSSPFGLFTLYYYGSYFWWVNLLIMVNWVGGFVLTVWG